MNAPNADESLECGRSTTSPATPLASSRRHREPEAPEEHQGETDEPRSSPGAEGRPAAEAPSGSTDRDAESKGGGRESEPGATTMTLLPPPPSWFLLEGGEPKRLSSEERVSRAPLEGNPPTPLADRPERDAVPIDPDRGGDAPTDPNASPPEPSEGFPADRPSSPRPSDLPPLPRRDSPESRTFDLPIALAASLPPDGPPSVASAIDALARTLASSASRAAPALLRECSSAAVRTALRALELEYARLGPGRRRRASDVGAVGGYFRPEARIEVGAAPGGGDGAFDRAWADGREVRFASLGWVERQLVSEWRTWRWSAEGDPREGSGGGAARAEGVGGGGDGPSTEDAVPEADVDAGGAISEGDDDEEFDRADAGEYERARTLAPRPLPRPQWERASSCYICRRDFGPTLHRHHCRRCGHSYCGAHSNYFHALPHLGYDGDLCERVCRGCKVVLDSRDMEERVLWRLARCRDFLAGTLVPYFQTGIDTVEDAAFRLTRVAIRLVRSIPLGAQAYVAIETVEILRKHGLSGVYGLLLRKEFLAAADLLCRVLGINKKNWPLSVHELSAAIFYALAQHRALRGLRPYGEELIHSLKQSDRMTTSKQGVDVDASSDSAMKRINSLYVVHENNAEEEDDAGDTIVWEGAAASKYITTCSESVLDETDVYDPESENAVDLLLLSQQPKHHSSPSQRHGHVADLRGKLESSGRSDDKKEVLGIDVPFDPVCEPVPDDTLSSLLFYAPLALNFIYAECEVDMQLLAAQQGWRLVYASLDQSQIHSDDAAGESNGVGHNSSDRPASALFAHDDEKIACLSVRGTATIQDVVTDIRAVPVPFPQEEEEEDNEYSMDNAFCDNDEWTSVFRGKGLASCGMAGAALNLFRENADSLTYLARHGYRIRIVGHSLGGGVATLLGILMSHHLEKVKLVETGPGLTVDDNRMLRVYGYGTPSCVDGRLADYTRAYVTNVVLHDDVVPRLTPTSIRSLLKHLLHIRETWVKAHLSDDLKCYHERAYRVWPTRVRESFTLLKKTSFDKAKKLKKSYKKRMHGSKHSTASEKSLCDDRQDSECIEYDNSVDNVIDDDGSCDATDLESSSFDEGMDVEGDLFFDALNDDPLNESDDESSIGRARPNRALSSAVLVECEDDWVPFDEPPMEEPISIRQNEPTIVNGKDESQQSSTEIDSSPQILEEFPLPRMFVPGKIVHIYTNCGGYKAAYVPRKFKSLRRISMAGNCLADHTANNYYQSLLEVKTVRSAKFDLPKWVGFDQDCTCACCASLFTWASTSNTEAQAARDKHNCRSCGGLVCDPCSKNKVPIPSIGITQSVRVCDRCYNGWGSLYNEVNSDKCNNNTHVRRSRVVDELASRLPTVK